jgi:hypothetical protein
MTGNATAEVGEMISTRLTLAVPILSNRLAG